jgi:hypothetical protein
VEFTYKLGPLSKANSVLWALFGHFGKISGRRIPGHFRGLFFAPRAQGDVVEVCLEVARSVRISMIFFFTQCGLFDLLRAVPSWTECFCCARERNIFFFLRARFAREIFFDLRASRASRALSTHPPAAPSRTFANLHAPSRKFREICARKEISGIS